MIGGCGAEGPEGIRCNRQHTVGGMHLHQAFDGKRTIAWETLPFAPLHDDHAPSAATTNIHNSVGRSDAFETTAVEVLAEIAFQVKRVADALEVHASHSLGAMTPGQIERAKTTLAAFAGRRSNP